jgi:hypothetical protein
MIRRILFLFILLCSSAAFAQSDSLMLGSDADTSQLAPDTIARKRWSKPKKAMFLSMAIPGLGQVYNGKTYWWKLPILYGGFSIIYLMYAKNQSGYLRYNQHYKHHYYFPNEPVLYVDPYTGFKYTTNSQLKTERDRFRRYRDMSVFFALSLYALNIMDAYVEAHLLDYDISDDLSMNIHPVFLSQNNVSFAPGLGLQFKFKNSSLTKRAVTSF